MAKIHSLDLNIRPAGGPKTRIYRFSQWIIRKVGDSYWSVKTYHLENVPETGPCLILSNHCSMIDPPIVGTYITREMHSLGRDNLFRIPLVGPYIRRINSHPIRREGIDREAIKTAARILDAGYPLLLFPEGTRSPDGKLQPARGGFGMILEQFNAPCLPVLLSGTERALGRNKIIPRPARVTLTVGRPFKIAPRGPNESRREYYDRCAAEIDKAWRDMLDEPPVA